jgi:hypothetical protein
VVHLETIGECQARQAMIVRRDDDDDGWSATLQPASFTPRSLGRSGQRGEGGYCQGWDISNHPPTLVRLIRPVPLSDSDVIKDDDSDDIAANSNLFTSIAFLGEK